MSKIQSLAVVARPCMQQKALSPTERIVNHVSCLQELDVVLVVLDLQAALSTSVLFFPFFQMYVHIYVYGNLDAVWKKMLSTIVTRSYSRHV